MSDEIQRIWQQYISVSQSSKEEKEIYLIEFLKCYKLLYAKSKCTLLDLSSIQSILMEHFITDIMSLCDENSKESVLEDYLLSEHGSLLVQMLALLTLQSEPTTHLSELAPLVLSLIDFILSWNTRQHTDTGIYSMCTMKQCFEVSSYPIISITHHQVEGHTSPSDPGREARRSLYTTYSHLLNLARNLGCVHKLDSAPENKVSIIILAHLIGVLGQQCSDKSDNSDKSDKSAVFIRSSLLLAVFSIANSILHNDILLLSRSQFMSQMLSLTEKSNNICIRNITLAGLLTLLHKALTLPGDDITAFSSFLKQFIEVGFKQCATSLFNSGEILSEEEDEKLKESAGELIDCLASLHGTLETVNKSGLSDFVKQNRIIEDSVDSTSTAGSALLFTFALSNSVYLQVKVLDACIEHGVVCNVSLKQTFTLLLWNYKHREEHVQCKVLSCLEKVVLTADKLEFLFPCSPCSSPQQQASDFKERFMNFSTDLFDKKRKQQSSKSITDHWSCLSDYCQVLRDSNDTLITSLGEHLTALCSKGSHQLRTKLLKYIFLKEIRDIGNYFALHYSKSNTTRQQHLSNIGISTMILYRDLCTPELIVTTIMPSLLHLLDDMDRKLLFYSESGVESLQYLVQHKLTRPHVLQLYQLLISGEHGPAELIPVSECTFVSLCNTIMSPPVCQLVENIQLEEEQDKCQMYSDVVKVLLRCARTESFHLAHFHSCISQLADHLAVLYAFIAEAQEKYTVQVLGLSLEEEDTGLVTDDKTLSPADKTTLINMYTALFMEYANLILGVYRTCDTTQLHGCYDLLTSILFPDINTQHAPSTVPSVPELSSNVEVLLSIVELCCENQPGSVEDEGCVVIVHPELLVQLFSGIATSATALVCSPAVMKMFKRLEALCREHGTQLQSVGLPLMLLNRYSSSVMSDSDLGQIIRTIVDLTVTKSMTAQELKLLLQNVKRTKSLVEINPDANIEALLRTLHKSLGADTHTPTHSIALSRCNQASWCLDGEIRWPSMYHGFSVSLWIKLVAKPKGSRESSGTESEEDFPEILGYRTSSSTSREPVQVLTFGHQRFTFVVSVDPTQGDVVLSWKGSERHPPHVIHRVLSPGSWHHVVVSYGSTPKQQRFGQRNGKILLWVDGCAVFDIGNAVYPPTVRHKTTFTLASHLPVVSGDVIVSSLMLFQDYMLNRKEVCHLLGLTANTKTLAGWNLTRYVTADLYNPSSQYSLELEVTNCFPYYQNVVNEALVNNGFDCALLSAHAVTITSLRNHLLLSWDPETPELLHQYSPLSLYTADLKSVGPVAAHDFVNAHKTIKLSAPVTQERRTQCKMPVLLPVLGGIKVLLMLFARVVEMSASEEVQVLTLELLFKNLVHPPLLCEMLSLSGYQMLALVLKSPNCVKNTALLKVLLDATVDGSILTETKGQVKAKPGSTAVVKNMYVLKHVLMDWKIWQYASLRVWELCCECLETLVRPSHPNYTYNLQQFVTCKIAKDILNFSQIYELTHKGESPPRSIISSLLTTLYYLLGYPADLQLGGWDTEIVLARTERLLRLISNSLMVSHPRKNVSVQCLPVRKSFFAPTRSKSAAPSKSEMTNSESTDTDLSVISTPTSKDEVSVIEDPTLSCEGSSVWSRGLSVASESSADMLSSRTDSDASRHASQSGDIDGDVSRPHSEAPSSRRASQSSDQPCRPASQSSDSDFTFKPVYDDRISLISGNSTISDTGSDNVFTGDSSGNTHYLLSLCDKMLGAYMSSKEMKGYYQSLTNVQSGLISLIVEVIKTSNESTLRRIFKGNNCVVEVEQVLVLINNENILIRIACIKMINVMLNHGSTQIKQHFLKINGYHLIALQLRQHPVTYELIHAVISLYAPLKSNITAGLSSADLSREVSPAPEAATLVLALLENCLAVQGLFGDVLKLMSQMFASWTGAALDFTSYGMIDALHYAVPLLNTMSSDYSSNVHAVELVLQSLVVLSHSVTAARHLFDLVWTLCFRWQQDNSDLPLYERLCTSVLRSAVQFFCTDSHVVTCLRNSNSGKLARLGSSLKSLMGDSPTDQSRENAFDPGSYFKEDVHVTSDRICNRTATLSELSTWYISLLNLLVQYLQHRCLTAVEVVTATEDDWTLLSAEDSSEDQQQFSRDIFDILLTTTVKCLHERVSDKMSPFIQLGSYNKDKLRGVLSRLIVVLYTPRLERSTCLYVLRALSQHGPIRVLPQLARSTDKFFNRIHAYTIYLMTDKEALSSECTMAAASILEVCQELNAKRPTDVVSLIHGWNEQEHNAHQAWLTAREQVSAKIGQPITILNKSINIQAEIITNTIFNHQGTLVREFYSQWQQLRSNKHDMQQQWYKTILKTTHQHGVWYDKDQYPNSWEIDSTEGPGGIRRRLKRCPVNIGSSFLMDKSQYKTDMTDSMPFKFIFQNNKRSSNVKSQITLVHTNKCSHIKSAGCTEGDILLYRQYMLFVRDERSTIDTISQLVGDALGMFWCLLDVTEVHKRWYNLRDVAVEIFLNTGQTYLLGFSTTEERDELHNRLLQLNLPNLVHHGDQRKEIRSMTQRWQDGEITNFEYLMHLNKQAGRTFNDLMQYPVLPFILADYKSQTLDLNQTSTFRNLSAPMAIQDSKLKEHFVQRYDMLKKDYENEEGAEQHLNNNTQPYHYGSHYSNSGIVLHYLVRLLPYAKLFIEFQGGSFDIPDRTFHDMRTTWRLASSESTTDVRELIPEFFYLPEMFHNSEGFKFGERQNGNIVDDVHMPVWAAEDSRLFILTHRMALESEYVSQNLHKWIDLVFGYKQQGQASIDAINVFHPSTYFGIDVEKIENPLHREAMRTMVKTYGQTPRQLFKDPHVTRNAMAHIHSKPLTTKGAPMQQGGNQKMASRFWRMAFASSINDALSSIDRERDLTPGTLHFSQPVLCWTAKFPHPIASIRCLPSGQVVSLPPNTAYLAFVPWKGPRYEQVSSFAEHSSPSYTGLTIRWEGPSVDLISDTIIYSISSSGHVTCCSTSRDGRVFALGYRSGLIAVWPLQFDPNTKHVGNMGPARYLTGHLAPITTIQINRAFSVIVSADTGGRVVIWDLNLMTYVNYFETRDSPVTCVRVSDTLGDIVTVSSSPERPTFPGVKLRPRESVSEIFLHTVNGTPISSSRCNHRICAVAISVMPEGLYKNVIATGFDNGVVWLWDTWTLQVISDIPTDFRSPILSLEFSYDSYSLAAGSQDGRVIVWTQGDPTST